MHSVRQLRRLRRMSCLTRLGENEVSAETRFRFALNPPITNVYPDFSQFYYKTFLLVLAGRDLTTRKICTFISIFIFR